MPPLAPEALRPAALADWLEGVAAGFAAAARAAGERERRLRVAGGAVCVRSAGDALHDRLGPALDHLAAAAGARPELTIEAWDCATTETEPPLLPEAEPGAPRGTVLYAADGMRRIAYQPGLGQLSAYDRERRTAWFWCRDAEALPFWEPAAPFRQILHWWLPERGALLLHGAAVGAADGGLLLVGRGGSGKSTCALSTLASGLLFAGDDYVAVAPGPEPRVHSLYCSGKLQPGHATLLRHLPPPSFAGDGSPEEKAVFHVRERFPERMCASFPLRAVVAPRVRGSEPRYERVSPARALGALAPSTLLQLVPARPEALSSMARLLERVPTYVLDVGGPVEGIPPALERILEEVGR
jgi:hypothetical protein